MAKVTAAAIFVSLLSTVAFLLWFEGEVSFRPLIAASIFALVLTVPVTLFILAQVDKLDEADADLAEARRQLFAIHLELQQAQQAGEPGQTADEVERIAPTIAGTPVVKPFQGAA
ncbi:hypothetical protein [Hoeflea sp.]|uniref:hypothetical protein n=1 Tax=Hoeflea sp. TaxID=1940281 RepID=UPI0037491998